MTTRSTVLNTPTGCYRRRPCSAIPERRRRETGACPAGLALSKDGKTLYVAAAFGHSVARFDAESGAFRDEIALEAGSYPYGLALDDAHNKLYVSLWSKARVAVVDTQTFALRRSGQPKSIPTRCCWRMAARFCSSPTPIATR